MDAVLGADVGASDRRLRGDADFGEDAGPSDRRLRVEEGRSEVVRDVDEDFPRRSDDRFLGLGMAIHIVSKNGLY